MYLMFDEVWNGEYNEYAVESRIIVIEFDPISERTLHSLCLSTCKSIFEDSEIMSYGYKTIWRWTSTALCDAE